MTTKLRNKQTNPHLKSTALLLFVISSILAGCHFPTGNAIQTSSNQIENYATAPVNVNFTAILPSELARGEKLFLEVVDEVTGLPYNNQTYQLESETDLEYNAKFSVPAGTVIKYRYVKNGKEPAAEINSRTQTIRYRMFFANTSSDVKDIILGWEGEQPQVDTGKLEGVVQDRDTRLPIPDVLISAGGQMTFSDANGHFALEGVPVGLNNVVFYSMTGQYGTFQQGAQIAQAQTTLANVSLKPMKPITVILRVTAPAEPLGAPIYLAGNLTQLGNTFTDLTGGMSVNPKKMPQLTPADDSTYSLQLHLYAQSDLRFKFTLGDGYWNAEQNQMGGVKIRQIVLPNTDITLDLTIASWRTSGLEPVTFELTFPPGSVAPGEKFIQFKTTDWTEPIPLWPLGNDEYLYILYAPFKKSETVSFRFCRNGDCQNATSAATSSAENTFTPSDSQQTISLSVDAWENWGTTIDRATLTQAAYPPYHLNYATMIELSSYVNEFWEVYTPESLAAIESMGGSAVIFSPLWYLQPASPLIFPELGITPFYSTLNAMINQASALGLETGLYPQLGTQGKVMEMWLTDTHSDYWWEIWFESYQDFLLNYAKTAEINKADQLIIGGKAVLPTFSGGITPDGQETNIPITNDNRWTALIEEIRNVYSGNLVWATNVHLNRDPLPEFIYEFDGIYISVDSPLAEGIDPAFEEIGANFSAVIDNHIYEAYRSTGLPITLALAYPSIDGAARGCGLIDESCYNDGIFDLDEISTQPIDLEEQALIYSAVLPVIASRPWITSTSIRGYNAAVTNQDGTSSIAGKPAADIISPWFQEINPE